MIPVDNSKYPAGLYRKITKSRHSISNSISTSDNTKPWQSPVNPDSSTLAIDIFFPWLVTLTSITHNFRLANIATQPMAHPMTYVMSKCNQFQKWGVECTVWPTILRTALTLCCPLALHLSQNPEDWSAANLDFPHHIGTILGYRYTVFPCSRLGNGARISLVA